MSSLLPSATTNKITETSTNTNEQECIMWGDAIFSELEGEGRKAAKSEWDCLCWLGVIRNDNWSN